MKLLRIVLAAFVGSIFGYRAAAMIPARVLNIVIGAIRDYAEFIGVMFLIRSLLYLPEHRNLNHVLNAYTVFKIYSLIQIMERQNKLLANFFDKYDGYVKKAVEQQEDAIECQRQVLATMNEY
jgi:hypothetical protein